jgi:hypothetical protein
MIVPEIEPGNGYGLYLVLVEMNGQDDVHALLHAASRVGVTGT